MLDKLGDTMLYPKTLTTILEEICEEMCNNYCKYTAEAREAMDQDEMFDKCDNCPLNKI